MPPPSDKEFRALLIRDHIERSAVRQRYRERLTRAAQKPPMEDTVKRTVTKTKTRRAKPTAPARSRAATIELAPSAAGEPLPPSHPDAWARQQFIESRRATTRAHDEPVSPCAVCGGEADAGDEQLGPWRRHASCIAAGASMTARVQAAASHLGVGEVGSVIAARVRVSRFADAHVEPTYAEDDADRTPWAHVNPRELRRQVEEARAEVEAELAPGPCKWGRCAWCGRDEDRTWHDRGHRWADGSNAPLCSACVEVYDRQGGDRPWDWDDQRNALSAALTGVPLSLGQKAPETLKAFAETGGGDGGSWSHLPSAAVREYRIAQWSKFGGKYCPPEHRASVELRLKLDAARRARDAREREAARDRYGFSGAEGEGDERG